MALTASILALYILCQLFQPCLFKPYPYSPSLPQVPSQGVPWPLPKSISFGNSNLTLDPSSLRITTNSTACQILTEAIQRYKEIILKESGKSSSALNRISTRFFGTSQFRSLFITIDIDGPCDQYPYLDMDESYTLDVKENDTSILHAPDVWGALRGLETFSQLIYLDTDAQTDSKDGFPLKIRTASVEDQPRFAHRGVLLDTSRHFLSVKTLKKNLDLMAFAKFNVFHWHIVDDPSFPYESALNPDLSREGAFSKRHVYSAQDVATIVEYGRLRGIRVIPEFDTPGHTLSWGPGEPGFLTQCYSEGQPLPADAYGVVDPSSNITFDFLQKFLSEVSRRFPDKYVHLGGDEVYFDCWKSNPQVQAFMESLHIAKGNEKKLEEYYMQRVVNLTRQISNTSSYIVWQEVMDNGVKLDSNAIIHVWKGKYGFEWEWEIFKATFKRFRTILSSCWYLNDIKYGENWEPYYKCDPQHFLGTQYQKSLVIGGEACMWGEHVDATNVLATLWPRASVVAERLWSQANVNDATKARPRLEEHRCRLVRRGYPASPVTGPGFCQVEYDE